MCATHLGDDARAADAFKRSIAVDAAHAPGYYKWAALERRRGRVGAARDLLQRGVWGCAGRAPRAELAKLHRARGELEAESTLRRHGPALARARRDAGRRAQLDAIAPAIAAPWDDDADDARAAFRAALAAAPAAATFAAWARFEDTIGETGTARALLEDGLDTVPGDAAIWREYVAHELLHSGDAAACAAEARAKATLGL